VSERDLVVHLARFGAALRGHGVRVALGDELDAATALGLVDLLDRAEVRRALLASLKVRRRDQAAFDAVFEALWSADEPRTTERAPEAAARRPPGRFHGPSNPAARPPLAGAAAPAAEAGAEPEGTTPGYSREALLRRKPFDECTERDLADMERLLSRLSIRLATERSRRLVPTRGRGQVDLRRSFRRSLATGGELMSLARRARALEVPRLVILCDTSGSMDPHARFLLAFILSLKRVAARTEVFAFNTELTRITPWLTSGGIGPTLDRLAAGVPDWSGGTRIGESLAEFVRRYLHETVTGRTTVVILSDGLDRGDPAVLVDAMRAIAARARQVIWLNPLLGDARYRPEARGMEAALPFVDRFAPAHNLESLERFLTLVAA
jgi:uncharacterized protein with von Willebrand factor type A (vWA) domain